MNPLLEGSIFAQAVNVDEADQVNPENLVGTNVRTLYLSNTV
jgi:hypothetical protein